MKLRRCFLALACLPAFLAPAQGNATPSYGVSFLAGADFSPTSMNNAGQIVGFAGQGDGTIHAMLYSDAVLSDLGSLGGKDSYATAINDAGMITGAFLTATGEQHAFVYEGGKTRDLGAGTAGYGINSRGDVVGSKQTADGVTGFVYRAGQFTELGNLGTGTEASAVAINDHGTIAGDSTTGPGLDTSSRHAFVYHRGVLHDLGTVDGDAVSSAIAINNAGQIAGYSGTDDAFTHAFLYDHGVLKNLGGFGDAALEIHDLNEHGTLVGTASTEEDGLVPFMNLGDVLIDLNTLIDPALGWHIFSARANNDLGQIVGYGCRGEACGLVMLDLANAVPEPRGPWLLLAGLMACLAARRHNKAIPEPGNTKPGPAVNFPCMNRAKPSDIRSVQKYLLALILLPALFVPLRAQAEALYTISVLPENFSPSDINNAGQMSGTIYTTEGGARAALYSDGAVIDLSRSGTRYSTSNAITEAGSVLGNFDTEAGNSGAFIYVSGTVLEISGIYGLGINAQNQVVGQRPAGGAVLYSSGVLTDLGFLGTGEYSTATAINDAGHIVGTSTIDLDFHSRLHPFLYSDGTLHDLGTLDEREFNSATAINSAGQISGYSEGENGGMHAFFYEHGVMTDLGSFGGLNLNVGGMNEHGEIVGTGQAWDGPDVSFISHNGVLIDLNTLIDPASGWQISQATAINDMGQIVGSACRDFICSAVRLDRISPVPEPGAALLLLPGLLMLAIAQRRRSTALSRTR